jgi:hypothetical protein
VLSEWEAVEFELSRLYSWFGGAIDDPALLAEYGTPRIFKERADGLKKKADKHFLAPDQNREGDFQSLMRETTGYADRRNDIAHGILLPIDSIYYFRNRIKPNLLHRRHFAIIPTLYQLRRHDEHGFPEFAYTSREMTRIVQRLKRLSASTREYRLSVTRGATPPAEK